MSASITNPPDAEHFCAVLIASGRWMKKRGEQVLMTPENTDLLSELADVLGRMERGATQIPPKRRRNGKSDSD